MTRHPADRTRDIVIAAGLFGLCCGVVLTILAYSCGLL